MEAATKERAGTRAHYGGDWLSLHPVASFVINGSGQILAVSQTAESLCNLPHAAMEGRPIADVVRLAEPGLWRKLNDPAKSIAAYAVALSPGRAATTAADIMISDALNSAGNAGNESAGVRIVAIHPRSPMTEPIIAGRSVAAKPAAAASAMLAHEIKNPLSGIKGAAQLLRRNAGKQDQGLTALICEEVDRIAALIDRMQDLSRASGLKRRAQNIYPALFQARDIARAGFAADIRIEEDYDPSLPDVLIDHDAIVQILLNLIKNAAEALAGTSDPMIRISTAYRHGLSYSAVEGAQPVPLPIELRVSDNGPGVPPQLLDAIFSPFVSGRNEGQGLGLALVEKLVRDHGGLIRHRRGGRTLLTHFEIHLPVAARS